MAHAIQRGSSTSAAFAGRAGGDRVVEYERTWNVDIAVSRNGQDVGTAKFTVIAK